MVPSFFRGSGVLSDLKGLPHRKRRRRIAEEARSGASMAPRTPEIDESTAKAYGWSRSSAHVAGEVAMTRIAAR